jgi:hypothetical protein
MKNELWGIRWNEERVGKSKCNQARRKLQQRSIDGGGNSQDSVMEEVLLFFVRAFAAGFFGGEISRQCVSSVNSLRFESTFDHSGCGDECAADATW